MRERQSLLNGGLKGTYVNVEPFHLFRYLDEQVFRFNHRKEMRTLIASASRSTASSDAA